MQQCTLLFLRRGDQILLAMKKRGFGANLWNGVGGKVDKDESIHEALIRECQEEIHVTPIDFEQIAVHDFVNDAATEPWKQQVHVFFCSKWEGEPSESEEMAPKWYSITDIPYGQMWQDDQMWLPLALRGRKIRSTFAFDEHDDIISASVSVVSELP